MIVFLILFAWTLTSMLTYFVIKVISIKKQDDNMAELGFIIAAFWPIALPVIIAVSSVFFLTDKLNDLAYKVARFNFRKFLKDKIKECEK